MNPIELKALCVSPTQTLRQAMECIDGNSCGIALVVDEDLHLVGTITDGDLRRAMLGSIDMETAVSVILAKKITTRYPKPVTARVGTPRETLLALMDQYFLRQIPILDRSGRVVDLVMMDDLLPTPASPLHAVIMAGGYGNRLRPLTEDLPKPMLPVGGKPLMERVVEQLREAGVRRVNVTTHYKAEKIVEYFGNGESFGIELNYVNEDQPLGTAGALGLMPAPRGALLVINGDILTQVNFRAMLAFHEEHQAMITVAVRRYEMQVPYGVVECEGSQVCGLREKPELSFFVNAGIYVLDPAVYQFIPNGQHLNMTDLIQVALKAGNPVVSFPVREYWIDIGQQSDYQQAQEDVQNGRLRK